MGESNRLCAGGAQSRRGHWKRHGHCFGVKVSIFCGHTASGQSIDIIIVMVGARAFLVLSTIVLREVVP